MVKQTIQIFCRVKPTSQSIGLYEVEDTVDESQVISFFVPKDISAGLINNKKETYRFRFGRIFDQKTNQDEIFDAVARPVIENVLSGFNGTIFAYGQTGSGKTFTITGGAERYIDRGIIPRSLSYVFDHFTKNPGHIYTVHISYLEIYNDNGYDLLHPNHESASKLEDLPKISMLEDYDGNIHLKNLSLNQATSEEEALNLLFLGDTNRMIAETPMNQASTRSHCIFTIHISIREVDSATIRRSKLHLVDLAGSERVGKTGVGGTLLKEAKYINLSLHMLEQVIIALSEKSRSHIPYRNSMMTSVLRDSLGGNCMTTMIATCSIEKKNIDESISTCRFAQRVAMVKNDALMNEELDPKLVIEKLKGEIQQLKDELSLAKGIEYSSELSQNEKEVLEGLVKIYIEDTKEESCLNVGADMRKISYCFASLKRACSKKAIEPTPRNITANPDLQKSPESKDRKLTSNSYLTDQVELDRLKDLIVQRDNEINILVKMLRQEKERNNLKIKDQRRAYRKADDESSRSVSSISNKSSNKSQEEDLLGKAYHTNGSQHLTNSIDTSVGRQEAFEIFKRDYEDNKLIEENKKGLKRRYGDAKKLGEQVNNSRQAINLLKAELQKLKSLRSEERPFIEEEKQFREELDAEKQRYKQAFNQLKLLKTEIEHMQHLLEKSKMKVQKDFEVWWCEQTAIHSSHHSNDVKAAWRTPPITPKNEELSPIKIESRMAAFFRRVSSSTPIRNDESNSSKHVENPFSPSLYTNNNYSRTDVYKVPSETDRYSTSKISETIKSHSTEEKSRKIPLTGDKKTDDDILAFMRAREQLLKRNKSKLP